MTQTAEISQNPKKIAIIYYSRYNHLTTLAAAVSRGVAATGAVPVLLTTEQAKEKIQLEALNQMDGIIFGSPTYFGGVAAEMRSFFEQTSDIFVKQLWRNKIAAGFTHSGSPSGDKLAVLLELVVFAMQHGMIWAGLDKVTEAPIDEDAAVALNIPQGTRLNRLGSWTGMMSNLLSSEEGDGMREQDIYTALYFGYRIGKVVQSSVGRENAVARAAA